MTGGMHGFAKPELETGGFPDAQNCAAARERQAANCRSDLDWEGGEMNQKREGMASRLPRQGSLKAGSIPRSRACYPKDKSGSRSKTSPPRS